MPLCVYCPGCLAMGNPRTTTVSALDCWKVRSTHGRPNSATGKSRTFCFPETMPRLRPGERSRQKNERGRIDRICWITNQHCHAERIRGNSQSDVDHTVYLV